MAISHTAGNLVLELHENGRWVLTQTHLEDLQGKLERYVKAAPADSEFITDCLESAAELVGRHTADRVVPAAILARAVLEVGADLFYRRSTRNGVALFDSDAFDQPVRVSRDPMRAADDLLRPFIGPAIA